jgi:hypothetical protein
MGIRLSWTLSAGLALTAALSLAPVPPAEAARDFDAIKDLDLRRFCPASIRGLRESSVLHHRVLEWATSCNYGEPSNPPSAGIVISYGSSVSCSPFVGPGQRLSEKYHLGVGLAFGNAETGDDLEAITQDVFDSVEARGEQLGLVRCPGYDPQPKVRDFPTTVFRSKRVTIELKGVDYVPKLAIIRHGSRVQFCNEDPIFHMPFIQIPSASTPAVSVTIPPGTCKYFFEELFAKNGEFAKQLKTPVASKVARRQVKQAFDRRTGRLLAPRRKGKLGVCWRLFGAIHADERGAIYVMPAGQKKLKTEKDVAAAEACFLGDSF